MTEQLDIWPTVEPIVPYGEAVLREEARPVKKLSRRLRKLLDELARVMYEAQGVGLAAPQVGESLRVAVVDVGDGLIELVNPEILVREGSDTAYEGCLSIPGYIGEVERASRVCVEAKNRHGRRIWVEGQGMLARALQHEIDHLHGILFVDRARKLLKLPPELRFTVVFMGTPEFGARVLEELVEAQCRVEGVVTQPDRPSGRGQKPQSSEVKRTAADYELPVLQPTRLSDPEFVEKLEKLAPDIIVTAAFGQLIPREVLDIPAVASINVHASLLPKYRGAAPIHRALLNGEKETGITIMYMDEGLDTGDIMLQERVEIAPDETAGSLHDKLASLGAKLTVEALRFLGKEEAPRRAQDDTAATRAKRIEKEEARIDWCRPAVELERMFRAFDPWPGAFTTLNGQRVKIFRGEVLPGDAQPEEAKPGTILQVNPDSIVVATGQGRLALTELQPANRQRISAGDYLRGYELEAGHRFE